MTKSINTDRGGNPTEDEQKKLARSSKFASAAGVPPSLAPRIGGSFAPPLSPEKLVEYRRLAEDAPPQIREAMGKLCDMMEALHAHDLPPLRAQREQGNGTPHPSGAPIVILPLSREIIDDLDPHVPWKEENEMYAALFEQIDPIEQRDLRNAAHHLLWFAIELFLDRHPLTADNL